MIEEKSENEPVLYHMDTSSVAIDATKFLISYSRQDLLEEPSNKDVFPHIRIEELLPDFPTSG